MLRAPTLGEHYLAVRVGTPNGCEEALGAAVPLLAVVEVLFVMLADYSPR
jgi:hypothetical protein